MKIKNWLTFSLINLLVVALLGFLMRYKIGFEFPLLDQKNTQEAHYHFAFYGWISHTLMVLMTECLAKRNVDFKSHRYNFVFTANLVASYGMLFGFLFFGHGMVSECFSVVAILISYCFTVMFVKDLKRYDVNPISAKWFRAALFFNFLSTLGIFFLFYMIVTGNILQNEYLATTYYFLHFQYNGWFFFACMGLFVHFINGAGAVQLNIYRLFAFSCIPAYFLSVLWIGLPVWLYVIVAVSALAQVYGLVLCGLSLRKSHAVQITSQPFILRYVLLFVGVALCIKLLLQLGSTIPAVSKLAFGFRPVVIAYLHLVLLAVISLFLLFYIFANRAFPRTGRVMRALLVFSIGVLLNEVVLAVQGIAAFTYTVIPYVNEMLFGVAAVLVTGIAMVCYYSIRTKDNQVYD
jgi:hypothetical protein